MNIVSRPWAEWFQSVTAAIRLLGGTVIDPQLRVAIVDESGVVSQAWGAGYFQNLNTSLNSLLTTASLPLLSPAPLATPIMYAPLGLRLAWVGWFQHVFDSIIALGGTLDPPQFRTTILNPDQTSTFDFSDRIALRR